MTTKEVLIKAKQLVEKGWTRNVLARNAAGEPVFSNSPEACAFCVAGAIEHAQGDDPDAGMEAFAVMHDSLGNVSITDFNDAATTTHADILAAFDRAIQECDK